jgi:hypothetical protein
MINDLIDFAMNELNLPQFFKSFNNVPLLHNSNQYYLYLVYTLLQNSYNLSSVSFN